MSRIRVGPVKTDDRIGGCKALPTTRHQRSSARRPPSCRAIDQRHAGVADDLALCEFPQGEKQAADPSELPGRQITSSSLARNLSIPSRKNIPLNPSGKSTLRLRLSHPHEGRLAIVTDVAVRCGGRDSHERRTWPARTAKSCGPGAPMLASSRVERSARRRWQESRSPGRARRKP
jgi:hypothetical protein